MSDHDNKIDRKGALGKGIHSLLGELPSESWNLERQKKNPVPPSEPDSQGELREVDPNLIDPNPEQPRKVFKDEDLHNLAASIAQDGVIQPLLVMPHKQQRERYVLIAGERRLRASKMAGLNKVPVLVREGHLDDRLRLAIIENIQRSDLNALEEAQAYQALIQDYGLTQEQCAAKVGKDRSTVANSLRMLTLPREVQEDLVAGRLSAGHAKALLSLDDKGLILQVRELVLKKQLNVRKTEQLCKDLIRDPESAEKPVEDDVDPDLEYIADTLRNYLRTKVRLSGNSQRGKIEISFFSSTELERLIGLINRKL